MSSIRLMAGCCFFSSVSSDGTCPSFRISIRTTSGGTECASTTVDKSATQDVAVTRPEPRTSSSSRGSREPIMVSERTTKTSLSE